MNNPGQRKPRIIRLQRRRTRVRLPFCARSDALRRRGLFSMTAAVLQHFKLFSQDVFILFLDCKSALYPAGGGNVQD